jgi:CspA family cold shock protein
MNIFGSPAPSAREYDATVKWFDPKKGYGVVALSDGIAVLHAAILRQAGFTDVKAGATLRVHIEQGQSGRVVSEVLSVDERTSGKPFGVF